MGGIILEWRQKTTRRSQTYYYFAEQESVGYNKNIPNGKATFMSQAIDISITYRFVNHFLHFFKYQLHFYLFFQIYFPIGLQHNQQAHYHSDGNSSFEIFSRKLSDCMYASDISDLHKEFLNTALYNKMFVQIQVTKSCLSYVSSKKNIPKLGRVWQGN